MTEINHQAWLNEEFIEKVYCVFQGLMIGLFSSAIMFLFFSPLGAPWNWILSVVFAGMMAAASIEKWPVAKIKGNRKFFYTAFLSGIATTVTILILLI